MAWINGSALSPSKVGKKSFPCRSSRGMILSGKISTPSSMTKDFPDVFFTKVLDTFFPEPDVKEQRRRIVDRLEEFLVEAQNWAEQCRHT